MESLRPHDPETIGSYRLLRRLGAGGMGRVYLGRSAGGRTVAVKVIRSELTGDPRFRERFRREVDAARRVGGLWTAPVLDADPDAADPWLVTAFVPGPSLQDAIREHGPLPAASVRALGAGLAEALIDVHRAGLVHRDLKPSNVLLSLDGPKVIDFGISRAVDATALTNTGAAVGSPAYMAPEQISSGDVGPASDIFAFGAVLTHAVTGTGPFQAPSVPAMMYAVMSREPDLTGVPAELRGLVTACLRKSPAERPTPREALASLGATDGAATLIAPGWLPAALVTALSRRAVTLLDLDAPPPTSPAAAAFAAGPGQGWSTHDPATSVPTRAPVAAPHPSGPGAYATGPPPGPRQPTGPRQPAGTGPSPQLLASPAPAPPPPSERPPRSRWPLPVPPLAVGVGMVGVGLVVLLVVLLYLLGSANRRDDARPRATSSAASGGSTTADSGPDAASSGPTAETSAPEAGSGAVPASYVGTWRGTITTGRGVSEAVVIAMRDGRVGDIVAHSEVSVVGLESLSTEPIRCVADLRLISTADGTTLEDVPTGSPDPTLLGLPVCTHGGQATLRLQAGGTMRYSSDAPGSGNPVGTLVRER